MRNKVFQGDCLEIMPTLPDKSVDMILCDLPYGTTACKWDSVIPFEPLWEQYERIIKPNGAIVLTASQPFTSQLVMSNPEWFKYEWIWKKSIASGFLHAKNSPLKSHENILVFSSGIVGHQNKVSNRMAYFPQMREGKPYKIVKNPDVRFKWGNIARPSTNNVYVAKNDGTRYPDSVLVYANPNNKNVHPTQKPVALFEYLIRTYTNEGDLILDNCAGSFTTAIAAMNTNRDYICIEKDDSYFELGCKRIAEHEQRVVQLEFEI